jgi:hypothetical protein
MKTIETMSARELIRFARRQAVSCFSGIAIPENKTAADVPADLPSDSLFTMLADRVVMDDGKVGVRLEKVLPFNRKALTNPPKMKESDPVGDLSIIRCGRPGSRERLDTYRQWNENNNETSPFMED